MLIYIILFIGIYIINYVTKKDSKKFCIITGIFLWLLLALRNISMGLNDTENVYLPYFEMLRNMSIIDIFQYRWMTDKVFFIIMKFIQMIFNNYQICLAIFAIPVIALPMYVIYKYSLNKRLSTIVFISLFYGYSFFLLRQSIALAIVLFSYKFICDKKFGKFAITILIAALFHKTALLVLILYPICNKIKFSNKNYILIILVGICSIVFKDFIIYILRDVLGMWSLQHGIYSIGEKFPLGGIAVLLVILIVSAELIKYFKVKDENLNCLLNFSTIAILIFSFSNIIVEAYRFSLYFSIFNVLLLSNALYSFKDINEKFYKIGIVVIEVVFILYFLFRSINNVGINPYVFF